MQPSQTQKVAFSSYPYHSNARAFSFSFSPLRVAIKAGHSVQTRPQAAMIFSDILNPIGKLNMNRANLKAYVRQSLSHDLCTFEVRPHI